MVCSQRLVNVVLIQSVPSPLGLVVVGQPLLYQLVLHHNEPLEHLHKVNVVDLNEVSTDSVVHQLRGKQKSVPPEPVLWLVLLVKHQEVPESSELQSTQNEPSCHAPNEQTTVVQWRLTHAKESSEHWTSVVKHHQTLHPDEVVDLEYLLNSVTTILTLTHLKTLKESTNKTRSLG